MRPTDSRDDRERRLFAVLAECVERLETGLPVSADELVRDHPEFSAEVAEFFANHRTLHRLVDPLRGESAPPPHNEITGIAVAVGQVPDYELLGELGRGGMAVVYKARDRRLGRVVALKMVDLHTPTAVRRFRLEAQLVATLDHPHVVPVYDVGEREGRPFFTMKLFEGGNLAELLAGGKWGPGAGYRHAAELVATVARAVHHAHEHGILHRDLKPANILLDGAGRPHVADFGLARRVEIEAGLTQSGLAVGTPGYIAPEQALGRKSWSVTADVYSLGAILYELITGRKVHRAATPLETILQAIESDPLRPRQLDPAIPRDLETICLKCLERDADRRYQSAAALADDLGRWLAGEAIVARPVRSTERAVRWARRHPAMVWAASAVAAVALAAAGVVTFLVQSERAAGAEAHGRVEAEARAALEVEHYFRTIALADRERLVGNPGRAEQLLDQCPSTLRGWEWRYLRRQPLGSPSIMRASSHLFCLAISPDGRRLAAGGSDGSITIGSLGQVSLTRLAGAHGTSQVRGVAFSPDGKHLASAGWDGKIKVWNCDTGTLVREWVLGEQSRDAFSVAFSPDGRILAASVDMQVLRWNLTTGESLSRLRHSNVVRRVVFSPSGQELASVDDDGYLKVWNLENGQPRLSFLGHPHLIFDLCYSRDGNRLLTAGGQFFMHGDAGQVKLWNASDGSLVREFVTNSGAYYAAALSPDGNRVMAGCEDAQVRVWDVNTGQEALSLRGHVEAVWGLVFSPDGQQVYTASGDHLIRLWDAAPLTDFTPSHRVIGSHELRVTSGTFSPDGSLLVSGGMDGIVQVRSATDGTLIRTLPRVHGQIHGLAFSPHGDQLAVAVWKQYDDSGADAGVIVWDTRRWVMLPRPPLKTHGVLGVAYSPDGNRLVAACDHAITALDTTTWETVWHEKNGCLVTAVAFGRDEVACADADGVVTFRDPHTGRALGEGIAAHAGRVFGLAYSPNYRCLATAATDGTIRIWDVQSRQELAAPAGHRGGVYSVAFTPDGGRLISGGSDGIIRVWDSLTGRELCTIAGHTDAVCAVAVHPTGTRLATGSRDRTVWLQKLASEPGSN